MSSSLTKGLRRSASRSKAKPAAKSAKRVSKAKSPSKPKAKRAAAAKTTARKAARPTAAKKATAKSRPAVKAAVKSKKAAPKTVARKAAPKKVARVSRVKTTQKQAAVRAVRPIPTPPPAPRPPTVDESAALLAFERAHKEFVRGRFAEARNQFRILLDKYSQVSEVAARSRTYLAIAESRLRTESILPRDADSLYDRGVIELNRGEYVAAQEMFERALKREPEAAHIHYGLAATRARLGSIDLALESLQKALDLKPSLRVQAQHDHDLYPLRNDPDFDRLISNPS
jgi:tetratricopeptide (TPR) repeat protein